MNQSNCFYTGTTTNYHDINNYHKSGLIVHFKGLSIAHNDFEPYKVQGRPIDVGSTFEEMDSGDVYRWLGYMWATPDGPKTAEPLLKKFKASFYKDNTLLDTINYSLISKEMTIKSEIKGINKIILSDFSFLPTIAKVKYEDEIVDEVEVTPDSNINVKIGYDNPFGESAVTTFNFKVQPIPVEAYVTFDEETKEMSFRYDKKRWTYSVSYDFDLTGKDRPWSELRTKATSAVVTSSFSNVKPTSLANFFFSFKKLTDIDIRYLDSSLVTDMSYMFQDCESLTHIDLSYLDTSNVEDMRRLFDNCKNIELIHLGGKFTTAKVFEAAYMFGGCNKLHGLDFTQINADSFANTSGMFYGCKSIPYFDLSSWNLNGVHVTDEMFGSCTAAKITFNKTCEFLSLNSACGMFVFCNSLTRIECSANLSRHVPPVDGSNMFLYCDNLVGQMGTRYNQGHTDQTYALVDSPFEPGYFSTPPSTKKTATKRKATTKKTTTKKTTTRKTTRKRTTAKTK